MNKAFNSLTTPPPRVNTDATFHQRAEWKCEKKRTGSAIKL